MKEISFKAKDGKEFKIKTPETSEEIEGNEIITINGKMLIAEELTNEPDSPSEEVRDKGELVYTIDEIYDLYYYNGDFYDFYWDCASGCIFCKLTIT